MNNLQSQAAITALIHQQTKAVSNKDIAGATANYNTAVVLFDVVGPLKHQGSLLVQQRLKEWFTTFKDDEPVSFETVDLNVSAGDDIAFSYSFNHINGALKKGGKLNMYWRETLNWQKNGEQWQIVAAHSSVPFDVNTGLASTGLKPAYNIEPESNRPDLTQIVKSYLEAYQTKNRNLLENVLHNDFTFTSLQDDHINKTVYFEKCWPFSNTNPHYSFLNLTQKDNTIAVLYECKTINTAFRNTEYVSFKEDKIIAIEVHFGPALK